MNDAKPGPPKPFLTRIILPVRYWVVCVLLLGALAIYIVGIDWDVHELVRWIHNRGPIPFFLALAILPALGFPTTPFFLVAGAAFGLGVGIVGSIVSQAVNLALCYWLATRYLHGFLERLIARTKYRIPQVRRENRVKVTLLVKITPGPPHFLKSYILGLAGIPFGLFFLVSLPVSAGYGIGIIVLGDSLLDRDLSQGFVAVGVLAALVVGIRLTRRYLLRRKKHEPFGQRDPEEESRGN